MITLNELEKDAIGESFNIGIGSAASALSEMVGQEVELSVPEIEILTQTEALLSMKGLKRITGVKEHFEGAFSGEALLLFPEDRSLELIRLLLAQDVPLEFLTEMEEEALVEVGNIILNACLSSIADIMGEEITNHIPVPIKGEMNDVVLNVNLNEDDQYIMKLRMDFIVKDVNIEGHIAFLMNIHSINEFRHKLASYYGFSEENNA